jgi:lon-related putative ATP-dependent protease
MELPKPLTPDELYRRIDPGCFEFATTAELAPLDGAFGQERAAEAVEFGIGMRRDGYNMYALGPPGMGKHHFVRRYLERQAAKEKVPSDWCYVHNFSDQYRPKVMRLPAGRAAELREAIERLIDEVRAAIAAAFESEEYRARRESLDNEFKERHEKAFGELQTRAQERSIALIRTPMGLGLAPVKEGEVINPDEFRKLSPEEQERIKSDIAALEQELQTIMRAAPAWQREHRTRLRELNRETTEYAVRHPMEELRHRYQGLGQVLPYLDAVQADIVENAHEFLPGQAPEGEPQGPPIPPQPGLRRAFAAAPAFRRYQVNVIVDRRGETGAPIVYEDHPSQPNLIGRIEQMAQFGALFTDFNLIKPGALHRANGGYLILDARKVLMQPLAWEELKRALRAGDIRIEGLAEMLGFVPTTSLQPEPIPLDVKVVLIGDAMIYYLLAQADPDFPELFKVAIDFEDRMPRDDKTSQLYARLLGTMARDEKLRPLDCPAVARVLEHSARLAGDSERLTAHMRTLADLLREADYWAGHEHRDTVTAADVQKAIDARVRRVDRVRELSLEQITRGTVLIDTSGAKVGQVNGLSVLQLGELAFGRPSRITARVRLGRGEVVDIEREVALGGPIHSKGVLILSGFLGGRFAAKHPLALSASLVFEQSYGGVEGDSASSAELYALLSALADAPIQQCLAVTGSVNQRGEVQAIGGANEKIEGFFDVCSSRGLDGTHGVLIPASNVKHLMLRKDVVEACAKGMFRVFPVATIDQGIEILTGVPAGEARPDGAWPEGSVNARVQARLKELAEAARSFGPAAVGARGDGER